ncbi:hypothetical protein F8S13_02300 [Chloroflexia bacterium SDU3-3]|nr:hypothetical protein F8S13_02300 [Chloroflexia bacterium SDU3-3]
MIAYVPPCRQRPCAERLFSVLDSERSDAERATEDRDAALDALEDWLEDFVSVAKVALRDDRQLLEALGIRA